MIHLFPIILADGAGNVIWLIIVAIAVISQIFKAVKKVPKGPGQTPDGNGTDAEAELRRFLESLSGGTSAPPAPRRPPPPPPPVPTAAPVRVVRTEAPAQKQWRRSADTPRQKWPSTATRKPPVLPRAPAPAPRSRPAPVVTLSPAFAPDESQAIGVVDAYREAPREKATVSRNELRLSLGRDLVGRQTLMKAILLQEVMGQPLALRRPNQSGQR